MEEKMKEDFYIIGKPFKIDNLIVAQYDFPSMLNWKDAKKACETLGNGWRLPTKDEVDLLKINRLKVDFNKSYWSSLEEEGYYKNYYAWHINFKIKIKNQSEYIEGWTMKKYLMNVRAVWSF
jgi:hypothetical protein